MATLRMSRRSGQIKLRSCIHLTDGIARFVTWMVANCWINWHLAVAKCAVPSGLSHRLVADCATVWDWKCLQLIYLNALPLTLFDIYSRIYIVNFLRQRSLSLRYDYVPVAWIFVDATIWKTTWQMIQMMGFGSFRGQTGWPCSKHESQRQNCWEAVEIGTW